MKNSSVSPCSLAILGAALLAITGTASAQTLVQWDFNGGTASGPLSEVAAPTTQAANVTGSNATQTGVTFLANVAAGGNTNRISVSANNLTDTLSPGVYLEFTLTAAPGYFLNISSLSYIQATTVAATGGTDRRSFSRVADSVTGNFTTPSGFASLTASGVAITNTTGTATVVDSGLTAETRVLTVSTNPGSALATYTAGFSGPSYSNLSSYTFRLYAYDNSTATNARTAFDDVTIYGTAVIPEPSTYALLGVGLLGLAFYRRRRKVLQGAP